MNRLPMWASFCTSVGKFGLFMAAAPLLAYISHIGRDQIKQNTPGSGGGGATNVVSVTFVVHYCRASE